MYLMSYIPNNIKNIISLDEKVDKFIDWYYKNFVKGNYTDIGEYVIPIEMRNFIEKMAVWYEFKYPDNDIVDLFEKKVSNNLENAKFYDFNSFWEVLSYKEKYLIKIPGYQDIVYLHPTKRNAHIHLNRNGFIISADNIINYKSENGFEILGESLEGIHISKLIKMFENDEIINESYDINLLTNAITDYEKSVELRDGILDCVMYRILERGENRIAPRRGLLFAKEFKRNIEIPMMYGVDTTDPYLKDFIIEYLKLGGSKDIKCYLNYYAKTSKKQSFEIESLKDIMKYENIDYENIDFIINENQNDNISDDDKVKVRVKYRK